MKGIFALTAALFAFAAIASDLPRPARVDFTSQPEGAGVVVDGVVRGNTPLTLFDLKVEGTHHVRFEMKNREPHDEFFHLREGAYLSKHAELAPVKGLLLVVSDPAGANISLDGLSLGETPRLITTLESGVSYRLLLQKQGYQPRPVEVKLSGRTPAVKSETLILDSGILDIDSEPAGAEVTVNGLVRGKTPLAVRDIPKGLAAVTLRLDGYRDEKRELSLSAGDRQNLFVRMEGIPGSLILSSVPDGARFYLNGEIRGKGPLTIPNLAPGKYTVRAEMQNYGTVERDISVGFGATVREEFRLSSTLGWIEVRTSPVGATVIVDGRTVGKTKSEDPKAKFSDVLRIDGIAKGEHTVTARARGYNEVSRSKVSVEPAKGQEVKIALKRVFTPDIEIVTDTGSHSGVLVNNGPDYVTIEVSMGVQRTFPRSEIRKLTLLGTPGLKE